MKKNKTKINKKKVIVEDVKKIAPSVQPLKKEEEEISSKSLSLRLFPWAAVVVLLVLFATLFFSEKNNSRATFLGDLRTKVYSSVDKVQNFFSFPKKDFPLLKTETAKENLGKPLEETSSMEKSKDENWWLNSGGIAYFQEAGFSTNQGPLSQESTWRKLYAKHNSRDTDGGYFPQNIFRLVSKKEWGNFSQSVYFKIEKINLSESEYRNESNGVLLFNRYQDGDNLYYTGLRVDGQIVIKKKIAGIYYTLLEKPVFKNKENYHRKNNPNLIPKNNWLGIKSELENINDDVVRIRVFINDGRERWRLVAETQDVGEKYGGPPFLNKGHTGIRTDFMDVTFRDYQINEK